MNPDRIATLITETEAILRAAEETADRAAGVCRVCGGAGDNGLYEEHDNVCPRCKGSGEEPTF